MAVKSSLMSSKAASTLETCSEAQFYFILFCVFIGFKLSNNFSTVKPMSAPKKVHHLAEVCCGFSRTDMILVWFIAK